MQIQALTWQGKAPRQQDSLLVVGDGVEKIIQDKGLIGHEHQFDTDFLIAVADGIASSPYSGQISKALLVELAAQFHRQRISLQALQDKLNDRFWGEKYQGAGSTLAMAQYHAGSQTFCLNHLGDSRIYHFDGQWQQWRSLTQDHTYINELRQEQPLDDRVTYASCYDILCHYFCIEYDYQITQFPPQSIQLKSGDFLLLCTDGVHDVLDCQDWLLPSQYTTKDWLLSMQQLLKSREAWDNMAMILVKQP